MPNQTPEERLSSVVSNLPNRENPFAGDDWPECQLLTMKEAVVIMLLVAVVTAGMILWLFS